MQHWRTHSDLSAFLLRVRQLQSVEQAFRSSMCFTEFSRNSAQLAGCDMGAVNDLVSGVSNPMTC